MSKKKEEDMEELETTQYPRRSLRKKRTRDKIIRATNRLVYEEDASNVTMNAVAEAADIHVTTLFTHFTSKADLFSTLSEPVIEKTEKDVRENIGKKKFFEYIRSRVIKVADQYAYDGFYAIEEGLHLRNHPELMSAWIRFESNLIDLYEEYLAADYSLDRQQDSRPRLIACMVVAANMHAYDQWRKNKDHIDMEKMTLRNIETAEQLVREGLVLS